MATYKNIRIKMKGGKTRLQRVKVLASGKYKFVKNVRRRVSRRTRRTRRKSNPGRKRGVRRLVRRYKRRGRRRGGKSTTRSLFKLVRLAALAGPGIHSAMARTTWDGRINDVIATYTGWNFESNRWESHWFAKGWTPYLVSVLATYGIPKIAGIIRRL